MNDLSFCQTRISAVVDGPIEDVWTIIRAWDTMPWLEKVDDQPLEIILVEGSACAVGSVRAVRLGNSQFFERLVAMDDEKHSLKWRLVSHPGSVSPFPVASFLNFCAQLALKEVTQGSITYAEYRGTCYTEHDHTNEMHHAMENWFQSALSSLQNYVVRRKLAKAGQERGANLAGQERDPFARPPQQSQPFPAMPQGAPQHQQGLRQRQSSGVSLSSGESRPDSSPNAFDSRSTSRQSSMDPGGQNYGRQLPGSFPQPLVRAGSQLLNKQTQRPMGALPMQHGVPMVPTNRQAVSRPMQAQQTHMGQEIPLWAKVPSIGVGTSTDATNMQQYRMQQPSWTRVPSPTLPSQWQGGLGGGYDPQQQQQRGPSAWPPDLQNLNGWPRR